MGAERDNYPPASSDPCECVTAALMKLSHARGHLDALGERKIDDPEGVLIAMREALDAAREQLLLGSQLVELQARGVAALERIAEKLP